MIRQAMVAGALLALWIGASAAAAQFGSPPHARHVVGGGDCWCHQKIPPPTFTTTRRDGTYTITPVVDTAETFTWDVGDGELMTLDANGNLTVRGSITSGGAVTTDHAVLSAAAFVAALLLAAAAWTLRRARQALAEARAAGRSMGAAPTTRDAPCSAWGCDCQGAP